MKKREGFTIVELLVAITLFSIAVSVAIGGFVRALRTQRQLVALIAANSNASLAIEQMAREIRTGTDFVCIGGSIGCSELKFNNANGESVTYRELNGGLERAVSNNFSQVTASNVEIRYLSFILFGSNQYPPRITVNIGVGGKNSELQNMVTNIQTTISSRGF